MIGTNSLTVELYKKLIAEDKEKVRLEKPGTKHTLTSEEVQSLYLDMSP